MDRETGHLPISVQDVISSLVWVKVIALGTAAAGKTCIIKHFCEDKFSAVYQPTVGVDYGFKIQKVKNHELRVHLWDLSGQLEYAEVRSELYGGTQACILVFDVTNRNSFESLEYWLKEAARHGGGAVHTVVVANKIDIRGKRAVSAEEAIKWAAAKKLKYYETSAMSGEGILRMFCEVLEVASANISKDQSGIAGT
ncbi:dnaJ homolog subfamily C member 27-B-like [Acanthaster planci]|uniref:DnaJ homolog subfamily C member 27-B-like n=1 Tax=Acanthaster planci TaxID=133434 RepID=A0A8B8A1E3_ACAPL|nr:dnaJ homolog subfamily C member 27-B-like [Acanthaster planci]XP_022109671.1 dnaJ homolog subfamily C member 27-B-like [Acanthaster planci]XP_022109681.1 dnaJ homolog subfamily C member 27-B-like [Acanthaster planci]